MVEWSRLLRTNLYEIVKQYVSGQLTQMMLPGIGVGGYCLKDPLLFGLLRLKRDFQISQSENSKNK